ncbi:Nse1 non-SMC component of SMC5-6 complex-domain-containing protein [Russula ochroleuca]|uniref:Non-structural maintenance of chromosomes element 1 homolog n=1 Tax=Russula ochroleuca TaxID=152965 RepID=A0A9P5MTZ9_9AGAM|nr:Nse1 non-SMC component of SMC5-6 complex-domain-containing protein [Russula ochroleuca]
MVSSLDVQRLFLQSAISRRVLSADLAIVIWKQCVEAVKGLLCLIPPPVDDTLQINTNRADGWGEFLAGLNKSLDPLDLELSRIRNEVTGKDMYALVNRRDDEIARIASDYSPLEISYFRALVEQIMLAPNSSYSISSLAALREVNALTSPMSKTQAESVLASFVAKGWLLKSKKGRFSLSPRALLELQPYLKSTYPDEILDCTICFEILTRGHACPRAKCRVRMHNPCYETYRRSNSKCPACGEDWGRVGNGNGTVVPVGEAAAPKDEWPRRTRRSATESENEQQQNEDVDVLSTAPSFVELFAQQLTIFFFSSASRSGIDVGGEEEPPRKERRAKARRC